MNTQIKKQFSSSPHFLRVMVLGVQAPRNSPRRARAFCADEKLFSFVGRARTIAESLFRWALGLSVAENQRGKRKGKGGRFLGVDSGAMGSVARQEVKGKRRGQGRTRTRPSSDCFHFSRCKGGRTGARTIIDPPRGSTRGKCERPGLLNL